MWLAIIVTLLPTYVFLALLQKLHLKSLYLKLTFAWFLGQYTFTVISFILATILSAFTTSLLQKASIVTILIFLLVFKFLKQKITYQLRLLMKSIKKEKQNSIVIKSFLFLLLLLFSYLFFRNHLELSDGIIFTSGGYWDFQWHMPLIQNFVFGDNFPPQNESFANFPHTYHFFWGVMVAIYSSVGLNLIQAINYVSILTLLFLLVGIIGIAEELFDQFYVGVIAVILTLTTSSLRFINLIFNLPDKNPIEILQNLLFSDYNPFYRGYVLGDPYGYQGYMFNTFYFLAERQMIVGIMYLLFAVYVIYRRKSVPNYFLLFLGAVMGSFFLWHLYITISILFALIFILVFDTDRKKTGFLFIGFSLVFFIHVLYFKNLQQSPWFLPEVSHYPKLNFNFPTMHDEFPGGFYKLSEYPLSILNALGYWIYGYGLKIPALIGGLILLWKKNKKLCITVSSIIIPTFILISTIQLSPLTIYDNHKWLRPMNIVVDIVVAYWLYYLVTQKKVIIKLVSIVIFLCLTLSALIELPPFLNAKPIFPFINSNSPLIKTIREKTPPKAVFIGDDRTEIQLAGRKLFLGNHSGQNLRLNMPKRNEIIKAIYESTDLTDICKLSTEYKIDYIEYIVNITDPKFINVILSMPHLSERNERGEEVILIDIRNGCKD